VQAIHILRFCITHIAYK